MQAHIPILSTHDAVVSITGNKTTGILSHEVTKHLMYIMYLSSTVYVLVAIESTINTNNCIPFPW